MAIAPQVCCLGAGFKVRHEPIVEQAGHALRDHGCQARVDCSMMGVFRNEGETVAPGRLDAHAFRPAGLMEVMVDVAVKHPCTESLHARAALQSGFASDVAEGEKLRDYRVPPGKVLTPFGVETLGRVGRCVEAFLQRRQTATTNRARLRWGDMLVQWSDVFVKR